MRKEVGKERKYEFRYLTPQDRLKIGGSRAFVFPLMIGLLIWLGFNDDSTTFSKIQAVSCILICVFAYLNLLNVDVDVADVFQWEFDHRGVEFAIAGLLFSLVGFFVEYGF
jgi:hypothetical protein